MKLESCISWGFIDLIETFIKANKLDIKCIERIEAHPNGVMITLLYDDDSDTAHQIMIMSLRHSGFENMLCDYLNKCGIPASLIPTGRTPVQRDMAQLDRDWEEYRKTIGLT